MWTVTVVARGVLVDNGRQVTFADDEHPVGALAADGAHPALRERVRSPRLWWSLDHVDAVGAEHRVEGGGEFAVPVAQQESQSGRMSLEVHQHVPRLLGDPGAGRMAPGSPHPWRSHRARVGSTSA